MDWDLIQNILLVLLILWNLSIIHDINRGFRLTSRELNILNRRSRRDR